MLSPKDSYHGIQERVSDGWLFVKVVESNRAIMRM